jgi:hypothetical protein
MPDQTLNIKDVTYEANREHFDTETPLPSLDLTLKNGLRITVARVELASSQETQLSVFINTEDLDPASDPQFKGGIPQMQICLNDATLYDCEPNTEGEDKSPGAAGSANWEQFVAAVEAGEDPLAAAASAGGKAAESAAEKAEREERMRGFEAHS